MSGVLFRQRTAARVIVAAAVCVILLAANVSGDKASELRCLRGSTTHKAEPEREEDLDNHCASWKGMSCCSKNTTTQLHMTDAKWNGFNYDHCYPISDKCRDYFLKELCMYECDPYLGQFIVGEKGKKFRKERFYKIPMCKQDCDSWFDACKYDYTCRDNWNRGFKWINGTNWCHPRDTCKTFKETFGSAKRFCSMIWDESFEVVDEDPDAKKQHKCFTFDFSKDTPNPNEQASLYYKKTRV